VTANVAGKTATVTVALNQRTGVTITAPTTAIAAGLPASFSVGVNAQANIRSVVLTWGDGSTQSLGAISASTNVSHIYTEAGTFTVTATATDTSGFSESVSSSVTVLPAQPPSVTVQPSTTTPIVGETVLIRAIVAGATSNILRYEWNFGSGSSPQTAVTTGNQAQTIWATIGNKVITVTVFQSVGPSGDGFGTVLVRSSTPVTVPR
jgi:hypothetical protein